jgi:hypothetical protein
MKKIEDCNPDRVAVLFSYDCHSERHVIVILNVVKNL